MNMRLAFLSVAAACLPGALLAQRLPTTVVPEHYALHLSPDLKAATFAGEETIDVNLTMPTNAVTLNSADIKMSEVMIIRGKDSQTATVSYDEDKQQATLTVAKEMAAGPAKIRIVYAGILNDKLRGFYLSKTAKRNYAVTQFESTDARRAFPGFDEPAMKATFDLSLTIDSGDTVIANTNMLSDKPAGEGKHTQVFAQTPKMSTYLLAFQVGDWVCSKGEADGIPIRSCSTPDKLALTPFALEAAEHFLHYYDQYFGVKYAMPKLDMIGIPDFEAGAMENWGCITYREQALLVDPKTASLGQKKLVAVDVAHEMAHQWFGDLVTMQWWDNLWLNEGFATWMEYKAVNEWQPTWGELDDHALDTQNTLNTDAAPTTRAIRSKADTPDEINQQFDGISYGKAGAVIGMVEHYLGPDTFEKGVAAYMQAHKYGNATAEDFWGAQTKVSGKPVDKIMESFVAQPGVPLLTFSAAGPGKVNVAQGRFFLTPNPAAPAQSWTVPVCVDGAHCTVTSAAMPVVPSGANGFENGDGDGYYRSDYAPELLKAVIANAASLKSTELITLLGDRLAFVKTGQGSIGDYLDLTASLKANPNATVLQQSVQGFGTALEIANDEQKKQLKALAIKMYSPVYASLPAVTATTDAIEVQRRALLFSLLGSAGDPAIIAEARANLTHIADGTLNPQLVQPSISVAARYGDAKLYDMLQMFAENATDPGKKTGALFSLAGFTDPTLVKRTLDYAVSGKVRNQDSWILFIILLQNTETQRQTWEYIKANWPAVSAQLTESSGGSVVGAMGAFCSEADKQDAIQFYSTHQVAASDRALKRAGQAIDACVALRANQGPKLTEWLAAHP